MPQGMLRTALLAVGINEFADLTGEEFASQFLMQNGMEEEEEEQMASRTDTLAEETEGARSNALPYAPFMMHQAHRSPSQLWFDALRQTPR